MHGLVIARSRCQVWDLENFLLPIIVVITVFGEFFCKNIQTSEILTSYKGKILLSIFIHWAYCM
jgi:hypothetical protein